MTQRLIVTGSDVGGDPPRFSGRFRSWVAWIEVLRGGRYHDGSYGRTVGGENEMAGYGRYEPPLRCDSSSTNTYFASGCHCHDRHNRLRVRDMHPGPENCEGDIAIADTLSPGR